MKRLTQIFLTTFILLPLLARAATDEIKPEPTPGKHLLDCSAFFGLLSQSKSEFAGGLKGFAFAATSYATVAFADQQQAEAEAGKSMVHLAYEIQKLQQDPASFRSKFETCIAVLKTAELELRPRLDETMKALIPEIFSGNQQ